MDQGARHEMRHSAACTCGAQESRADRVARYPDLVSIRFAVLNIASTSTRCGIRMSAYRAPVSTWNRRIMYAARPVYATVEARAAPTGPSRGANRMTRAALTAVPVSAWRQYRRPRVVW